MENNKNFFINNPIFVKYKKRFDLLKFQSKQILKSVNINERIIEIPYAIQALADLPRQAKVLDLGCTESPLPLQLAGLGYQVTGFDFREYPYQHPNLKFVQGDITKLPFENNHFDAVISISTLEHIGIGFYDDPTEVAAADKKAMGEVIRVLKPGGLFVLTAPYGTGSITTHQRVYDEGSLAQLLTSLQLKNIRYFKTDHLPQAVCNTWVEINKEEASQVASPTQTRGVCLVTAIKS